MVITNMRPIGWGETTPRQWDVIRKMVRQVVRTAVYLDDPILLFRANAFLLKTEGFDV
jgi:hypothetical protein